MPQMIGHAFWGWLGNDGPAASRPQSCWSGSAWGIVCTHRPRELSGGEMQRAAIARALIDRPKVLLADEPTGNLDAGTGGDIVRLLRDLNREEGLTMIMVTHDQDISPRADRVVRLVAGPSRRTWSPAACCGLIPAGRTEDHPPSLAHSASNLRQA